MFKDKTYETMGGLLQQDREQGYSVGRRGVPIGDEFIHNFITGAGICGKLRHENGLLCWHGRLKND